SRRCCESGRTQVSKWTTEGSPESFSSTGKRVDIRQLSPGCWPRAKRDQTLPDATITQAQSL
ncbi:MAG: hypothetical protein SOI35_06930, partial [Lacticaseibacillus paracasei]